MDNLGRNERATLVKEIAHIHFAALTLLDLGGNRIESIEGLACMQMAHMQMLLSRTYSGYKENNNISRVGVLGKAAWPALPRLDISK